MAADRDIVDGAQDAYANLKDYFTKSDNYWQLGNAFDTMTDYLLVAGPAHADPELPKFVQEKFLNPHVQSYAGWYDDYAWWAIASAKAYDKRFEPIFGSYAAPFAGIAQSLWTILDQGKGDGVHLGAPQVFTNRDNETMFIDPPAVPSYWAAPRLDGGRGSGLHGVWQYDMFANKREAPNWIGPREGNAATNPSLPASYWLGPYQLTVVNALYLLLAVRLEQASRDNPAVPPATLQLEDEYGFLWAWFGYDPNNPISGQDSLLEQFSLPGTLVRERVSTYAFLNGKFPQVENWDLETSWGGDQGMILNALTGYLRLHPGNTVLASLIQLLVRGYLTHMTDSAGVPQPFYPFTGNKLEGDLGDYKSGIGVFMRGLLQAYQTPNNPIASMVPGSDFQSFLRGCLRWADSLKQEDLFDSMNVLATLTAAMVMLR